MDKLISYKDLNGKTGYQEGEDKVLQTFSFNDILLSTNWSEIDSQTLTVGSATIYNILFNLTKPDNSFSCGVYFHIQCAPQEILNNATNQYLTPNVVKISLSLKQITGIAADATGVALGGIVMVKGGVPKPPAPKPSGQVPAPKPSGGLLPKLSGGALPKLSPKTSGGPLPKLSPKFSPLPQQSPKKSQAPKQSPLPQQSPKKSPGPINSPLPQQSPKKSQAPVNSPVPMQSPKKSPGPINSPLPQQSPKKSIVPMQSPKQSIAPVQSPKKSQAPVNSPLPQQSPKKSIVPVQSPKKSVAPVQSPVQSPKQSLLPQQSPKKSGGAFDILSPYKVENTKPSPPRPPVPRRPNEQRDGQGKVSLAFNSASTSEDAFLTWEEYVVVLEGGVYSLKNVTVSNFTIFTYERPPQFKPAQSPLPKISGGPAPKISPKKSGGAFDMMDVAVNSPLPKLSGGAPPAPKPSGGTLPPPTQPGTKPPPLNNGGLPLKPDFTYLRVWYSVEGKPTEMEWDPYIGVSEILDSSSTSDAGKILPYLMTVLLSIIFVAFFN